jgi:dihydroorotase
MALYATAFDSVGAIDRLEGFAAHFGADFYGLDRNNATLTLRRESHRVPGEMPFIEGEQIIALAAGQSLAWQVIGLDDHE